MSISNAEAIKLALMPGSAESFERSSEHVGNMARLGMAKEVKGARNVFYVALGLASLATFMRTSPFVEGAIARYAWTMLIALDIGIAGMAVKKLFAATANIQKSVH